MTSQQATPPAKSDPWKILGLAVGATVEQIRAAYLAKVKEFPPERSPAEFELVRDAYELLRSPRNRAKLLLVTDDPMGPMLSLLDETPAPRPFIGPRPWLDALEED